MNTKIRFGAEKETTALDENGSTLTVEKRIADHKTVRMLKHYSIRDRVHSKQEETAEYLRFSDTLDATRFNAKFEIVHTKDGDRDGYYYVVKSWSEVVK